MFRLRSILAGLILLLTAGAERVAAHVVQQLYAEFQPQREGWRLEIWFDAGYADPRMRDDPGLPQPTRDWLVGLTAREQLDLVAQAEGYLREILRFRSSGGPVEWRASCPDLRVDPPDFPVLLNDGAYFRLVVEPATPRRGGELELELAAGRHPDLVIKTGDGEQAGYLTVQAGQTRSMPDPGPESGHGVAVEAFRQGFLHVIPKGADHILFVLGIFLLARSWRPLLAQSLAFTAAHTLTLGLAAASWIQVPGRIVEPLIALSITALAVENLFVREVRRRRLGLVFAFGLIHGLGFAGVLATWIPAGDGFLPCLLAANLGVELGQVAILLGAWVATLGWHRRPLWETFRRGGCGALALAGLWWFVERSGGF